MPRLTQMMDPDSDLLRPSLTAGRNPAAAIYSIRTGFLSAFFGGPIAGAAIALLNAYRLKRLTMDWPIGLIAIAFSAILGWFETHGGWHRLDASFGQGSDIYATRIINLMFFGIVYAFHRTYYKSMAVLAIESPNGLLVGIGAIILGLLANEALVRVFAT
jgi:hypothetical protein